MVANKYVLVYLQSGVLFILDACKQDAFEVIRSVRISQNSFDEKPAPVLTIGQNYFEGDGDQVITLQISDKSIAVYSWRELLEGKVEPEPIMTFNEPHHNSILDCQLI